MTENNSIKKEPVLNKILTDLTSAIVVSFLTIAGGSAFGVLTGLGAQAGIISMIIASLIGWVFGGVKVKVSGPTGPTTSVMLSAIIAIQALNLPLESVFIILAFSGIILIVLGFFPMHKFAALIPNVATAVFINGVAVIILENQLHKVVNFHVNDIPSKWWDTGMALGSLLVLFIWPKISKPIAMSKLGRLLSGSLLVMVLGGIINFIFNQPSAGIMVESELFKNGFPLSLDLLSQIPIDVLLFNSLKIAFIVFFVTIVSVRAIVPKGANYKVELFNIGAANLVLSFVGGIASSIGFVRSKLLQNNGGQTVFSGIFTALLVLLLLLVAKPLLQQIPVAVFIGILVKAVWGSIDWQFLNDFKRAPKNNAINFFIVLIGSISMIWIDQTIVVIVASTIWLILNRRPSLKHHCADIEVCPISHQKIEN